MRSVAQWGQRIAVPEPAIGVTPLRIGLVSITEEQVAVMDAQGHTPAVRDWTIYARADGQESGRLAVPRAQLRVRYGSGASSYIRTQRIPVTGTVLHVVATWLDVEIELADSTLPPVGEIALQAYASPGRPTTSISPDYVFTAVDPTPVITVPPFARSVVIVDDVGGVPATQSPTLVWRYQGINRLEVGAAGAPQDGIATSHLVPIDASELAVTPAVLATAVYWWWELWS